MIRLRPFDKMSYTDIRMNYLSKLVEYEIVEFDKRDILYDDSEMPEGKSAKTYNELAGFSALRDYLYNDKKEIIKDNLRQILVGPEEAPRSFGGENEHATMRSVFDNIIHKIERDNFNILKAAVDVCKKIFKYNKFNTVSKKITETQEPLAYWLQSQLDVKVCPYCNRMYTTTLYGKKRIRPDFDHFYPQSRYPYLAVSLFNLIPSCNICNKAKFDYAEMKEDFKKEKSDNTWFTYRQKKSIIYPYDESYNELHGHISFRVVADEKEAFMGQSDNFTVELRPTKHSERLEFEKLAPTKMEFDERFRCKINSNIAGDEKAAAEEECAFWERAKQTIELLRLESFYNEHKLEIMKILRIHYEYNKIARQFIMLPLNNPIATVYADLVSNRDLQYFAFLKPGEWRNSPLNKLKSDILDQLNEIEDTRIIHEKQQEDEDGDGC